MGFHFSCCLWFRKELFLWWRQKKGVIIVRDKKKLVEALSYLPSKHHILLESHAVDSILFPKQGWEIIEKKSLRAAHGLITNCRGTMQKWEEQYPNLAIPRGVVHNATSLIPTQAEILPVIRCIGSIYNRTATLRMSGLIFRILSNCMPVQ